jgi:hypothetical protein
VQSVDARNLNYVCHLPLMALWLSVTCVVTMRILDIYNACELQNAGTRNGIADIHKENY